MIRQSFRASAADAFFGADREHILWSRAEFADSETEAAYQRHLVDHELSKERAVTVLGVMIYLVFGVLDVMTFRDNLGEVLFVRLGLCGPAGLLLVALAGAEPFRRHFQWMTAITMLIGGLSMVWMIAVLPPSGAPPYIVGILVVFIFFACIQRIHFWLAAAVFLGTAAAYVLVITLISPKASQEVASGLFFMVTITLIALATMYTQEIRARLLYFRSRQRELDAAFIEELLIEATAADQSKLNFLSLLSHELRTPLHQIIGFSEVVRSRHAPGAPDETREFLDQIHTSAHGLLSRIAKMLRYADATAGKVKYEYEDVAASDLVDSVAAQCAKSAAQARVTIDAEGVRRGKFRIDFANTVYALSHLVENAINASPEGGVVRIAGETAPNETYVLKIADQGCGMSDAQIAAAFEPFSQTEALRTRTIEGVGLGLTLARKILTDQKAELRIASKPGEGTTVFVSMPREAAQAAA